MIQLQQPGPKEIPTTTPPELTPYEEPMEPEMPGDEPSKEEPEIPAEPAPDKEIPQPGKES